MSDPERLLDGPLSAEVESLLRSADVDAPVEVEDKQRRLLAVAAATTPWVTPRAVTASSSNLRNVGWIGLAAAALVAATFGIGALGSSPPSSGASPAASATVSSPTRDPRPFDGDRANGVERARVAEGMPDEARSTRPYLVPSLRVDELPSATPPRDTRAPQTSPKARPEASVEDELQAIDAARGALAARRPARALAHLDHYRSVFRDPHFVDEADALEVQALAALGRSAEAQAKAEQFFTSHPGSPYTQRVRSATASTAPARDE